MGLEGLDGALGSIVAMEIGRDKLLLHFLHVFNCGFEGGIDLIVKDLEINVMAMVG